MSLAPRCSSISRPWHKNCSILLHRWTIISLSLFSSKSLSIQLTREWYCRSWCFQIWVMGFGFWVKSLHLSPPLQSLHPSLLHPYIPLSISPSNSPALPPSLHPASLLPPLSPLQGLCCFICLISYCRCLNYRVYWKGSVLQCRDADFMVFSTENWVIIINSAVQSVGSLSHCVYFGKSHTEACRDV